MSCLNFEYMLVGQILLDETSCCNPSFRPPSPHKTSSPSYHPPTFSRSSLLSPLNMFCDTLPFYHTDGCNIGGLASPSPRTMERALYPIYEAEEEGKDYDDDEDEDDEGLSGAFNVPFLRFFKSCLVQFAYMMPVDKSLKSPPQSPQKRV